MTWPQAIIVYFVCWWLIMFMALPIGIKAQEAPAPGIEKGAPEKSYFAVKAGVVTVLAALATWGIDFVIHSGIVAVK